jgi:hypothetical protein
MRILFLIHSRSWKYPININMNPYNAGYEARQIESLMGIAIILVSGSIFVSLSVNWKASASTEE